jgi:hypothetical protein
MGTKARIVILWMVAAFVVAGSAVGFAKTGSNHSKPSTASSADDQNGPNEHANENAFEAQEKKDDEQEPSSDNERKLNHGFYVSQAAACEDVDDPDTTESPDFTAPADCKDGGKAHGEYVSSVARSSAGKPDKAHGPKSE